LCAAIALSLVALACELGASGAVAAPEHSFDAALSLEGGCKGEDGLPDPGCPGGEHPPKAFDDACGAAVDRHGDVYVASGAIGNGTGKGGRIDVFNPKGEYLTEIKDENHPCDLAVDSAGNLYVVESPTSDVVLFEPESFPPQKGEEYIATPIYKEGTFGCGDKAWTVAVDPSNDHLYVGVGCMIAEYASAAEGSGLVQEGVASFLGLSGSSSIDVYGKNHNLYLTSAVPGSKAGEPVNARLYVLDNKGEEIECEASGFSFFFGFSGVGIDQSNGDVYVDDTTGNHIVKQFDSNCGEIGQLPSPPVLAQPNPFAPIAVDDPCVVGVEPCNPSAPYDSPNQGYVFVGSGSEANKSHLYAYAPKIEGPPEIEEQQASGISEGEATLEAKVNPKGSETKYHFEYVTQAQFNESEYAEAISTPEEDAGAAASFGKVSAAISGLLPGTTYRFRAVASNCASRETETECLTMGEGKPGEEGADASFSTYPTAPQQSCPNEALRIGPSASLPDCRAYELVTPAQTNGRIPTMSELGNTNVNNFATDLASADGESLSFGVEGGTLPGSEGGGFHDTYVARRGASGWQSEFSGLRGSETTEPYMGSISPDNRYSFWFAGHIGAVTLPEGSYLRSPGGVVEPIGVGNLGSDPQAIGRLITAGGSHVIFTASKQLEEGAPDGPTTIYDRPAGGPTQILSLLPGDVPSATGAEFQGASADGTAVAFTVNGTLYLRRDGATQEVTAASTVFGGFSADGERLTYMVPTVAPKGLPPQGELFSYDAASGKSTPVGAGSEAILVNVSADGSHVFFATPKEGSPGKFDLRVWDAGTEAVGFIATVSERDVYGEPIPDVTETMTDGLGLWVNRAVKPEMRAVDGPGADPSRSTPDGSAFIFESRESHGPYPNAGHAEVYRYSEADGLACLSCDPSGVPGASDARLQGPNALFLRSLPPVNTLAHISNLSADGQIAFFQSADPLVASDNDGRIDVYEWEAEGRGGCALAAGCLSLISSPHSGADEYLYAATPDARNVFIETADSLLPSDPDGGNSIYDARVEGGFAEAAAPPGPCQGTDACRTPSPPPPLPNTVAGPFPGQNASPAKKGKRCPKGKRKVKAHGKAHCVKKHKRERRAPR